MKIKSDASPTEKASPFYQKNEDFCYDFERFIASKNGLVKGSFNAWTYTVFGKIEEPRPWNLMYKRAMFSSNDIFLSSEYQNLLLQAKWTTQISENINFSISHRKALSLWRMIFNTSCFHPYRKYRIEAKNTNTTLIQLLTKVLKPLFISNELYAITLKNNELTIEIRTETHHFDLFEQLVADI